MVLDHADEICPRNVHEFTLLNRHNRLNVPNALTRQPEGRQYANGVAFRVVRDALTVVRSPEDAVPHKIDAQLRVLALMHEYVADLWGR